MTVSAIVAIANNYAMGRNNQLPWHLPEDLKFFMRTTMGHPVIMGRKTFDSLGKPLKNRLNIVLSRQHNLDLPDDVMQCTSLDESISHAAKAMTDEIFIIGGAAIFNISMPIIDRLYITQVDTEITDADTFFPHIDHSHWKLIWQEPHTADEKHLYDYTFQKWERVKEI